MALAVLVDRDSVLIRTDCMFFLIFEVSCRMLHSKPNMTVSLGDLNGI